MTQDHTDLSENMLSAYLDDELDAIDRTRVERAMAEDPAWGVVLDDIRIAHEAVRALPPRDLPSAVWDTILETVASADAGTVTHLNDRRRRRVARWVAGVAAAAAALALFIVPGNRDTDGTPPLDDIADNAAVAQTTASDPVTALVPVGVQAGLAP